MKKPTIRDLIYHEVSKMRLSPIAISEITTLILNCRKFKVTRRIRKERRGR